MAKEEDLTVNATKHHRFSYIGFNDRWFSVIGILVLACTAVFVLSGPAELTDLELVITFAVSLFFSTCDWIINRSIMVRLRKRYPDLKDTALRFALLLLGISITIVVVDFIGVNLIALLNENVDYQFQERIRSLVITIVLTVMVMAIYEAFYFFIRLRTSIRQEEQSKQAIVQAQLDALQNQAQPHFFFNTLNTLRDIIEQNPKEDATRFVDNLSDMYRFLLESSKANVIPLREELKFAKAYLHIQSERFGSNLKLNWNIDGTALDAMIIPMSLQLLLENAIKHNVISKAKPLEVNITLADETLTVENRIQPKSTQLPSTKVGLENIKQRYALITDQPVHISNNGEQFSVTLPLFKNILSKDASPQ